MSSEILRRAAALMRERAEAATTSPWDFWSMQDDGRLEVFVPNGTMSTETVLEFKDFSDCEECARPTDADAAHIASWHPAVALAVADMLDHTAEVIEQTELARQVDRGIQSVPAMRVRKALTVARAYLGGAA